MADNTFRTTRRDPAPQAGQQMDDPLAELARLIGQGEPVPNPDRARRYDAPPLNDPAAGSQWPADDRYASQQRPAPAQYQDPAPAQYDERQSQYDERQVQYDEQRYDAPPLADPQPPYRPAPPTYDARYEQPDQYAAPAQQYDARGYPIADQPYDDAHDPIQDLPSFLPRVRGDRYDYAQDRGQDSGQEPEQAYAQQGYAQQAYAQDQQGDPDDPSYALEDYEEEEAPPRKRRGFAVVAALLGLMVLGTAGAFAYRTMFGGTMLPSLPPIIRADNTPNKIVPAGNATAGQASSAGSPDKLVSREEKPVDVPPANTPRVVSTIPIYPNPTAGLQSSAQQGMTGQNMSGAMPAPMPGAVPGYMPSDPNSLGPTAAAPAYGGAVAPAPTMPLAGMAGQGAPMQTQQAAPANAATKKIHTVAIHPGQDDAAAAASQAPAAQAHAAAPARPLAPKPFAAAPAQGGNAPLSIVPSQQGDTAASARTRTAVARPAAPAAEPVASSGGGYSVQVSSQRSEAEAQSAYHGLQAKYPSQLGGHTPTVRQVNLGDKGVFYRTLVGPYASMEQAAQMCSSLKAAGGSCIVQRN
jgi:hypothetical protein